MYDELNRGPVAHEPTEFPKMPKKAAASGWIGSVLEYYDFSIYAQAAALVFPTVFFPKGNATVALVSSLATYAVGYLVKGAADSEIVIMKSVAANPRRTSTRSLPAHQGSSRSSMAIEPSPWRSDFTSVPASWIPASNLSSMK